MGKSQPTYISLWLRPQGDQPGQQVHSPSLDSNKENFQLDPGMETATTLAIASCSQRPVEAADPADAERPRTSRQQEAGSPFLQLLPSIEGDLWQSVG